MINNFGMHTYQNRTKLLFFLFHLIPFEFWLYSLFCFLSFYRIFLPQICFRCMQWDYFHDKSKSYGTTEHRQNFAQVSFLSCTMGLIFTRSPERGCQLNGRDFGYLAMLFVSAVFLGSEKCPTESSLTLRITNYLVLDIVTNTNVHCSRYNN